MDAKLPELLPVVIPPISHPPFHCQGNGLLYKQNSRESIDTLRSWITSKRKRTPLQKPKDWWRAQLLLYGLHAGNSATKVAELTEKLKTALENGLQVPTKKILDLEKDLNAKFRLQNAEARDRKYLTLETDDNRADFDPIRFLQERFPPEAKGENSKGDLLVLNLLNRSPLHAAAGSLGLCSITTDAPGGENSRWIVVGRNRDAIVERKLQIEAERRLWRIEEQKREGEKVRARREEVKAIARGLEARTGKRGGVLRDIVGEWYVESRAISREWPQVGTEFHMSIYFHRMLALHRSDSNSDGELEELESQESGESSGSQDSSVLLDGTELLWANFDLGLLHGVLHANVQLPHTDPFPSDPIPFSWRGRDFSEEQIQLKMEGENRGTITFLSSTKLKMVMKDCAGRFKFEGYKLSTLPALKYPQEWNELTVEQWNRECESRWH